MSKKRSRGFTLIELIAVLVIMLIIAIIVTPLVLNVVRKAKDSANKRSVDAYGKSIDLAVASYLLDTKEFPTSFNELTIEYTGKEVVCGIEQLNEDSSVYLSECTVGNSEVKDSSTDDGWYHYGKPLSTVYQSYSIGDQVTYNGMNFYVIADSDESNDSVTVLKAEPIKTIEVDLSGTEIFDKALDKTNSFNDGYVHSAYLYSDNCTSVAIGDGTATGCTTDYKLSSIKQVVDAWAKDKFKASDLSVDKTGYSIRLISHDDLIMNLGYENKQDTTAPSTNGTTPAWIYNSNYGYWTMSQFNDSVNSVWIVYNKGALSGQFLTDTNVVRPVVTLKKSAI